MPLNVRSRALLAAYPHVLFFEDADSWPHSQLRSSLRCLLPWHTQLSGTTGPSGAMFYLYNEGFESLEVLANPQSWLCFFPELKLRFLLT